MSKEFDLISKKYVEKYGKTVIAGPLDIFNFLIQKNKKDYKKEIDYDKYFSKKENEVEYIFFNFLLKSELSKNFLQNEHVKSMKQPLIGPLVINLNKINTVTLFLNKKKQIQIGNTFIFAFYNVTDKKFMWTYPKDMENMCSGGIFKNLTFCKNNMIKNITINEADALAIWYRTHVFYERNIMKIGSFKDFKTTNLIKFELDNKGKIYIIYTLVDYGIKDPKLDKNMKKALEQLESIPFLIESKKLVKNKKNSMKGFKLNSFKISNQDIF